MIDEERLEEEIRQVAYEIYVKSGCIPGRDLDNWLEAKRIIFEKYGLIQSEESEEKTEKKKTKRVCKRGSSTKRESKEKRKK
ncbi:MAG: DUF2934 domain-containing protein [Thermodesulfovibrio sp.]|jgi:hypothetical protein|uniref:DUF2934 domain-containing protein n=1 Tax=unclassified Thermodesulfovibrio TaxID=2645936 RepID=UPI00083A3BF2|nr:MULTISPECIES: DUF2934 domain-containing protein [unclassified Thermodesulfovibrio]MDI1472305.1 DUF2934 domain-containing protein [Thermodesulfovibrio sp. 1176]MDI6714170.1 DUF2934 domain-containing protein [Thermodesulfovibrio sp.]ODA44931.1 hypothetical protein THER_0296 [Thermodesulfovibrio sp. N1]